MTDNTTPQFIRPALPDLPTFARPPFRACALTGKVWGRSEYGDECLVADVRGWGYLTGLGAALGLPDNEAFSAQVKTANFITEAMNAAYANMEHADQRASERDSALRIAKHALDQWESFVESEYAGTGSFGLMMAEVNAQRAALAKVGG